MARGTKVLVAALAVCVLASAVAAVPTARRIRAKTARAHMGARAGSQSHAHALVRAGAGAFPQECSQTFIPKDEKKPLRQDSEFYTFPGEQNVPFTWKPATGDAGHKSQSGLKAMLEWQTAHAQSSFRFLIIAASKAMSGWTIADAEWWKANKSPDLPEVAGGQGWDNQALVGRPKGMASAWRKVKDVTDEGYHYDFTRLLDGLRASFVFADPAHIEPAVCWFRKWITEDKVAVKHHCKIVQDKDRWTNPIDGGYKDFMLNMQCNWGDKDDQKIGVRAVIVEVQFHACSILMAKQGDVDSINNLMKSVPNAPQDFAANGHKLYEQARELKLPAGQQKLTELNAKMSTLYANAALVPAGKCKPADAPKFYCEKACKEQDDDLHVEDLTAAVKAAKMFEGVNAQNYHGIGLVWA